MFSINIYLFQSKVYNLNDWIGCVKRMLLICEATD